MEHHSVDLLDREMGHWQISPNGKRWQYYFEDLTDAPLNSTRITLSKNVKNWELISQLPDLVELTLDRPDKWQIEYLAKIPHLKRLRISHTRAKSLNVIEYLSGLEELVLEYVSGINQLDAIGALPNIRALHLENLRNVKDFSGLSPLISLGYLNISGNVDWKQTVESFSFVENFGSLEILRLTNIKILAGDFPYLPLSCLTSLKKISLASNVFELEFFAWLQAKFPHVIGSKRMPFSKYGGTRQKITPPDICATMPEKVVMRDFPKIEIDKDGNRWRNNPHGAFLLGKGERTVQGSKTTVDNKCSEHEARYQKLVKQYSE